MVATNSRASSTPLASICRWLCGDRLCRFAIGALLGAVVGYRGGWVDNVAMRGVDSVMAFPAFVLAMGITAAIGNSTVNVAIAISITQIPSYLRLIRGEMLRVREMEYADAARTVGNRPGVSCWFICCRIVCRR